MKNISKLVYQIIQSQPIYILIHTRKKVNAPARAATFRKPTRSNATASGRRA